jgi:drug/metabolite transporter (DMT)-like permease
VTAATPEAPAAPPSRALVLSAFAAVYIIWGSTYLAIRITLETMPPFLMAGTRFLASGAILYLFARGRGAARPTAVHWRSAAITGFLLLVCGNGGVVWSEQLVPSGITSLLVTTVPLWMVLLHWLQHGGDRPSLGIALGIALGLAGVAFLVGPGQIAGSGGVNPVGAGVLLFASIAWAIGSLYSRHAALPPSPFLAIGMEMLAGGALLTLLGVATGELKRVDVHAFSTASMLAWLYLTLFGALVGFTAYLWLMRVSTPARVSTYAFVNPVVAVFLGWIVLHEPVTPRTIIAAAMIVSAVALITLASPARAPASQ